MRYNLYGYSAQHADSTAPLVLSFSDTLPDATPNSTMTGEQIGYAITPHNMRKVGLVEVPDCYKSRVDGEYLIINESHQYTAQDLRHEFGVKVKSNGMHWIDFPLPA